MDLFNSARVIITVAMTAGCVCVCVCTPQHSRRLESICATLTALLSRQQLRPVKQCINMAMTQWTSWLLLSAPQSHLLPSYPMAKILQCKYQNEQTCNKKKKKSRPKLFRSFVNTGYLMKYFDIIWHFILAESWMRKLSTLSWRKPNIELKPADD